MEKVATHYGTTPSRLLRQPVEDFHLDMAMGIAAMLEQGEILKARGADDTWKGIMHAVYSGVKAAR